MRCLPYKKCLSAVCLELRRLRADLTVCFKILRGFTNVTPSEFCVWSSSSTRGHSMKLYHPDSRITARQIFSLFVLSNYGINCQKKRYQPAVSVLFIARLNSMHVSFLMFCFSAVCFLINVSFRAAVSALWAFLSSRHSSALYCFYQTMVHQYT